MSTETAARLFTSAQLKFAGNADAMTFSGYGAVFGNVDAHGDVIERGAFRAWLADVKAGKQPWPAMLSQHGGFLGADGMTPVGSWTSLAEDATGLLLEGKLADTPRGLELYQLAKMQPPAISGLSIGYAAREWTVGSGKAGEPRRTLKRVDVLEVSLVTFPANDRARLTQVKCERPRDVRTFEVALREIFGFSSREAKRLAAGGWSALARDDSEEVNSIVASLRAAATEFQSPK